MYYLEADWRKRCFVDEEWWFYAALAGVGALVYIVGLPITITLALLHHHKRSRLRYPHLGVLTPASIAASVVESEKHFRVRLKYGDLYWVYKGEYWWFEAPQILRKLILTGAIALVPGVSEQLLLGVLVSIAYAILVACAQPYASRADNRVALVDAVQVLVTLLIGLYVNQRIAAEGGAAQRDTIAVVCDIALVALNAAVVVVAVGQQPPFVALVNALGAKCRGCTARGEEASPPVGASRCGGADDAHGDAAVVGGGARAAAPFAPPLHLRAAAKAMVSQRQSQDHVRTNPVWQSEALAKASPGIEMQRLSVQRASATEVRCGPASDDSIDSLY